MAVTKAPFYSPFSSVVVVFHSKEDASVAQCETPPAEPLCGEVVSKEHAHSLCLCTCACVRKKENTGDVITFVLYFIKSESHTLGYCLGSRVCLKLIAEQFR